MKPEFRTAFQNPDTRLFEISGEPNKHLTQDELIKLQRLMPQVKWISVHWAKPHPITNPSYVPYERKST